MASITVTLSGLTKDAAALGALRDTPREVIRNLDSLLYMIATGTMAGATPTISIAYSSGDIVLASQTYTISSGSGTMTATIGGTAVTCTWATSDANTAALLAAAINANATTSKLVLAAAAANIVTVRALVPGTVANKITTTAAGTGNSAQGATLTGGAGAEIAGINASV